MERSYFIGVDLHRVVMQICIRDERGEIVAEKRVRYASRDEGLAAVEWLRTFAPARVTVEAVGLNRWFVNACREAGLAVLVCDPRKLDLKKFGKKTDRRDARELSRRLWLGDLDRMATTYYPSDEEYGHRKLLRVRHQLVQMRQQAINPIRGLLNAYQIPAPAGVLYTIRGRERLRACRLPTREMQAAFDALVHTLDALQNQIDQLSRQIEAVAAQQPAVAAVRDVLPQIGAQSAATLVYELGDARRFRGARAVAALPRDGVRGERKAPNEDRERSRSTPADDGDCLGCPSPILRILAAGTEFPPEPSSSTTRMDPPEPRSRDRNQQRRHHELEEPAELTVSKRAVSVATRPAIVRLPGGRSLDRVDHGELARNLVARDVTAGA